MALCEGNPVVDSSYKRPVTPGAFPSYVDAMVYIWVVVCLCRRDALVSGCFPDVLAVILKIISSQLDVSISWSMMTSWNGNGFRAIRRLLVKSGGHLWIPLTKVQERVLRCLICCQYKQTTKQTVDGDLRRQVLHCDVTVMRLCGLYVRNPDTRSKNQLGLSVLNQTNQLVISDVFKIRESLIYHINICLVTVMTAD